jgi:hypothetical protein
MNSLGVRAATDIIETSPWGSYVPRFINQASHQTNPHEIYLNMAVSYYQMARLNATLFLDLLHNTGD